MTRLIRPTPTSPAYRQTEIDGLKAALNRAGYDASEADIVWAWEMHSESYAAGWLGINGGDEEFDEYVSVLRNYMEEAA